MSRTIRWYHKIHNKARLKISIIHPWKQINPYYFKHELRIIRIKIHRQVRRNNKIRLQKGWDIELEQKTNGWITH